MESGSATTIVRRCVIVFTTFMEGLAKKSGMKRYLYDPIKKDLLKKMVILTGPRQVNW